MEIFNETDEIKKVIDSKFKVIQC